MLSRFSFRMSRTTKLELFFIPLVLFVLAACEGSAFAQVPTGSIVGAVDDAQHLPIADASVILTNEGTNVQYTTASTSLGVFEFTQLQEGVYRLEVSKPAFRNVSAIGIKLDTGTQYSLPPIIMQIGPLTQTITVEAGASLVQSTSAELNDTVERKQIDQLPFLDRNPLKLLGLEPGVAQNGESSTVINGQRTSFGNVTLDGINIQDNLVRSNDLDFLPNRLVMGQVDEFSVATENAGPQAGLGSSQVSFVTPSGTNIWHGEGFWYYRSDAMAANDWFNDANGLPKPNLLQNQGGANVGGPILKNRLFVYGWYELLRFRQSVPRSFAVLTPDARNGIFTWVPTCGGNGQPACPSGVTPGQPQKVSLFRPSGLRSGFGVDPFIATLLTRLPTTINNSSVGDGLNTGGLTFNQRNNSTRDNYGFRLDWNASAHHSFAGTWAWNRDAIDRGDLNGGIYQVPVVTNNDSAKFLSIAWRWSPRASFTNELRAGFNLTPTNFLTSQGFSQGFTLANLLFSNPDSTFLPQGREGKVYSWQDNATYIRGNHLFSAGVLSQRIAEHSFESGGTIEQLNLGISVFNPNGLHTSDFTSKGGISANDLATANALFTSLAGILLSAQQSFNITSRTSGFVPGAPLARDFTLNDYAWYAGDSWRLRKNLTLNYGVRWEYVGRFNESNGLLLLPVIRSGQTAANTLLTDATLNFAGSGQPLYAKDLDNFAPHVSLAWDPWGNGKTAVRAGYSIYYVNDEAIAAAGNAGGAISNGAVVLNAGLSATDFFFPPVTSTISSGRPTITTPTFQVPRKFSDNQKQLGTFGSNGSAVDPNFRTPYVQQWNLTVQRDLGWRTSLSVSYVGNRAIKLYREINLNQVLILPNGFLDDFNRARSNGFANLAAGRGFDPRCDFAGCQPLTVFPQLAFGGALGSPFVEGLIEQGQAGELVNQYHIVGFDGNVPLVPNPVLFAADFLQNGAYSDYNAGVVEVRRRFGRGLYLQANYTWSKVLTDSNGAAVAQSGLDAYRFDAYLDNARPGLEKARAQFDLTHAFKANFLYELPVGTAHRLKPSAAWLNRIVSGWNVSSLFTWQSGAPFSILSDRGTLNSAFSSFFKNTASSTSTDQQVAQSVGLFFQNGKVYAIDPRLIGPNGKAAPIDALTCTPIVSGGFCNPNPGTVGNLGRNAFDGPAFFDWDFSLIKQTNVTERMRVEYRAVFTNFLNHPSFYFGPVQGSVAGGDINSSEFGLITSTSSFPRTIQMGLRLVF